MANLRRSSKKDVGGRSKPNEACKKHPKHKQSPGVCSLCLRQKLSQLSSNSSSANTTNASSSSSLSSYCSSISSASSYSSSPMHRYRFANEGKDSFSLFSINGKNMLTKSRSVACVSRLRSKEEGKKNKIGFFSKLFHPSRVQ